MLNLAPNSLTSLEGQGQDLWISRHARKLREMLPHICAMYTEPQLERIVTRILIRAETIPLKLENATLAFGWASLTFGIGFEADEPTQEFDSIRKLPSEEQAEALWDYIDARLEEQET